MKKLGFTGQLFILFAGILLITTIAFSAITITTVRGIANEEVYSRLSSYSMFINNMEMGDDRKRPEREKNDMKFGYIIYNNGTWEMNSDLDFEITDTFVEALVASVKNVNNLPRIQGRDTIESKDIYYVCQTNMNDSLVIIFTDDTYAFGMIKSISIRSIMVFITMIFISILVISWWSNVYIRRIRNLQLHIENMPNNKYEKKYVDGGDDEVGQLSCSIEKMRLQIYHNEETKQEMLQNLSHDFKTPIAVIKSYAEAIQDGVESTDALNIIIEQADLLKSKVIKLLQYNSIEYLDKTKPFIDIEMDNLINDVVLKYKHQSNINFNLDLENVIFKGYYENWDIVLSNIIENALRYAQNEIKIILRPDRIRIYNDGEHIDEKFIGNQFKPYEKGSKGQFGLGMSIVEKTVNFFDYKLSVKNEEPVGVSFIIESSKRSNN
jgi:two-component system sensor histidine kinase CssS